MNINPCFPTTDGVSNTRLIPETKIQPQGFSPRATSGSETEQGEGDTGGEGKKILVNLDYLSIKTSIHPDRLEDFWKYVSDCNYIRYEERPASNGSHEYYENRIEGTCGIYGGDTLNAETGFYDCFARIPGKFFEGKDAWRTWTYCVGLHQAYGCRATRLDIAVDDHYENAIPLKEMIEASDAKCNFHFRHRKTVSSGSCGEERDTTEYFGSRESSSYARIYRHFFAVGSWAMRYEAEFKRALAARIFDEYCTLDFELDPSESPDIIQEAVQSYDVQLQQWLGSIAVGCIDFRDKSSRKDESKASIKDTVRLSFWQEFIDLIGSAIRFRAATVNRSVEKSCRFLSRQVSGVLAAFRQGLGGFNFFRFMREIEEVGDRKLGRAHAVLIEDLKRDPSAVFRFL